MIDDIDVFIMFGGCFFKSAFLWVPTVKLFLLTFLVLYSYEADFMEGLFKKGKKLAQSFNFMLRYILVDDVLSPTISKFGDYFDHIYPIELEIKDTKDTAVRFASYLTYT